MAYANSREFYSRIHKIEKRKKRLARGYALEVKKNGIVEARPVRQGIRFPYRMLFVILAMVMAFKAFVYADIGPAAYNEHVAALADGSMAEKAGAWAMTADTFTVWMAAQLNLYVL
ncbi:hypothetical protein AQS8620_01104 [Aquimixticola soesokkakensis]|uniref:Uncharacterized protein n=1 Tax=Aquimixticola soesokkakensis TaxID=1519096 RepID=A0A1Y5S580_9RHOB|nr:hypothetical protein [Aquimixticola soesokkakensis]SLN32814.1 hypothetical protein AQS8620_01104 [Aquimixticola soesokkakensis]